MRGDPLPPPPPDLLSTLHYHPTDAGPWRVSSQTGDVTTPGAQRSGTASTPGEPIRRAGRGREALRGVLGTLAKLFLRSMKYFGLF